MDSALLVYPGGSLKMVSDGTDGPVIMEGYLALFTDETRPDRSAAKDYFTPDTDLGLLSDLGTYTVPAYYHHGMHPELGTERIGSAELKTDDVGVFARYEIRRRKEYLRALAEEAEKEGVGLGQSSGAWPLGVARVAKGGGVHELKAWPIYEASITPTPAEPGTGAAVKSVTRPTRKTLDFSGGTNAARERVESAARAAMPGADYVWVEDLYPGAAIVNAGDDAVFRIPVTDDGDTVTLSPRTEWQPVERVTRYEDAAKALSDAVSSGALRSEAAALSAALSD